MSVIQPRGRVGIEFMKDFASKIWLQYLQVELKGKKFPGLRMRSLVTAEAGAMSTWSVTEERLSLGHMRICDITGERIYTPRE